MFELAVAIGLIIGFLRGGSLERLSKIPIKFPILFLLSFGLQAILAIAGNWVVIPHVYGLAIVLISYLILLSAAFLNREDFFMQIILVGIVLNFLVISLNGGMPVSMRSAELVGISQKSYTSILKDDIKRVPVDENTRLGFLGDIIPVPPPYPLPAIYSIGDFFMAVGLAMFLQKHLTYLGKRAKEDGRLPLLD